jgi:uncharacterized membrane protein YhfC
MSLVAMVISTILCFGTPVLLYILVRRKANKLITPLLAGLLGFTVMQVIIRIPILTFLQVLTPLYSLNIFLLAFILAFTAGLFETVGRVLTIFLFMKDDTRFTAGLTHGIGHGGIEAMLLVGFGSITNIIYSVMINSETFLQTLGNSEDIVDLRNILIDTHYTMFLLGGIERVLTIVFHITLSVLVVYAFRIKRKYPVFLVLLIHTLLDFTVVILAYYGVSAYLIEGFILVAVLIMIYVTYIVYNKYKEMNEEGANNV